MVDQRESGRFRDWVEIVATVGVVLSLLFVGYEIRQNTAMARGQARQELAALNQEWLLTLGQDAEFEAIWHKAWVGRTYLEQTADLTLTESESRRAWFVMTLHLRRLENVYFQYHEGLVDESALDSYGFTSIEIFRTDPFRIYWIEENGRSGFDPDFADYLDQRIAMARPVPAGRDE